MWVWVLLGIACVIWAIRFTYETQSGRCTSKARLDGKTVIVTGASAGIGKATAQDLASRGARVIMACRNVKKAKEVADDIIHSTGNGKVVVQELDVSSLASVRRFARDILSTEIALHVLVNNAGVSGPRTRKLTSDSLELTMATNHFGHFLLTNMLLGLLKRSSPSRVINVSSSLHFKADSIDPDDMNYEKSPYPSGIGPYGKSKLANILFTNQLSNKLRGTGVTANCLHPGIVNTEITEKGDMKFYTPFIKLVFALVGKDLNLGAQTTIHLAVSEEVAKISGEYFVDCKISDRSAAAKDQDLSKRVWEASENLVKLTPDERHY